MKDYESATDDGDCPFCEGQGEQEIHLYNQLLVLRCEECRGSGQVVELLGADFDEEDMIRPNG